MVKLHAKNNQKTTMSKNTKQKVNIFLYLTLNNGSNFTRFYALRECCRRTAACAYRQKCRSLTASSFWIRLAEELPGLLCRFLLYFFFISTQSMHWFTLSFLPDLMTVRVTFELPEKKNSINFIFEYNWLTILSTILRYCFHDIWPPQ